MYGVMEGDGGKDRVRVITRSATRSRLIERDAVIERIVLKVNEIYENNP
jgi:hypothetical protein